MSEFSGSPECISFFGPDGAGKSHLASMTRDLLVELGQDTAIMGGSNYKEWLTNNVARDFCGEPVTDYESTRLYESIAVACYGLANRLREEGKFVIIDSDPYLKRMVWAYLELSGEGFGGYVDQFEQTMTDMLGRDVAPGIIVLVDPTPEANDAAQASRVTQSRIMNRGVVTGYDPKNEGEGIRIYDACEMVKTEVIFAKKYPRITGRVHAISNPQCDNRTEVSRQLRASARTVLDFASES